MSSSLNELREINSFEYEPLVSSKIKNYKYCKICNNNRMVISLIFIILITSMMINIYYFMSFKYYLTNEFENFPNINEATEKLNNLDNKLNNLFKFLCKNYNICV